MALALGPMPPDLRETVRRWIEGNGSDRMGKDVDAKLNAVSITGGPAAGFYLDPGGEIWRKDPFDDLVTRVDDGPDKVSLVAWAARYLPELATWLPCRPPEAADCAVCAEGGLLLPPLPGVQCPECVGLGWILPRA